MIYVNAPDSAVITITDPFEVPVPNGIGTDGKPKFLQHTYQQFLLARTTDETFAEHSGKKEGFDLLELIMLARKQIKATAGAPGPHVFDVEVGKRLQAAILKPKIGRIGAPEYEHNWYDWSKLWKDVKEDVVAAAVPQVPNV